VSGWEKLGAPRTPEGAPRGVEYDFRTRFGCGLNVIGRDMTLAEAARHAERFRADPSSALAAEIEGWEYPISREALTLMDLWDLTSIAQQLPKKRRPNLTAAGRSRST
jgi:hypothetical protein